MRGGRLGRFAGLIPAVAGLAGAQDVAPRSDPVIISIHPFVVQQGAKSQVVVRGRGLRGARAVFAPASPLRMKTEGVEAERLQEGVPRRGGPVDLVHVEVEAPAGAPAGRYMIRLVGANGVSNALPIHVADAPVIPEPEGVHETAQTAVAVAPSKAVYAGRLSRRGEADFYSIDAKAGQTFTFAVLSGLPHTAVFGSAATIANFDPSIAIYEPAGSWLNPRRLNRIAYNDEPSWVFGKGTDAHLVHRFQRDGKYFIRVEAFAGQGGPDYSYQLRVLPGEVQQEAGPQSDAYEERTFTRPLASERLNQLAARGDGRRDRPSIETYRAAAVPAPSAPVFQLPGIVSGTLTEPGELHRARFAVDGPRNIAIEVETPGIAPPYFNPIIRMLNAAGEEVATNLQAGRGACNPAMNKSLQAKTLVPLREPGEYTVEVFSATTAPGPYAYRLMLRPQIPHVGQVRIESDHVNLLPAGATSIRISFDREEDFQGGVAVSAEGLPPGVQALVGADYEPERDPPQPIGKRERYQPRPERTVLVLAAAADAPPTSEPQEARIVVRPLVGGKLGEPVGMKTLPVMVIEKQ
jgi:hypothetical protein